MVKLPKVGGTSVESPFNQEWPIDLRALHVTDLTEVGDSSAVLGGHGNEEMMAGMHIIVIMYKYICIQYIHT